MWISIAIIGLLKTLIIFTYLIILCKGKKVVNFPSFFNFSGIRDEELVSGPLRVPKVKRSIHWEEKSELIIKALY